MAADKRNIAEISPEQRLFILGEKDLMPNFIGWHRIQVPAGQKWLIYCDGRLVEQFGEGPHSWWNGFLKKWKAQKINTRVELIHIPIKGRVKGPSGLKDLPGKSMVEMACDVTADLELSVKIVDIENFIQYRDPLSVFLASIQNMVVELIGQLPYDQYGQWATELRTLIQNRLQGNSRHARDNAEQRLGIRVEDVFITEFKPSTVNDRTTLHMYQLVERARRELVEAEENAKRDRIVAQSHAEQGDILNIAPSILALQNSPIGKALIEHDAELRGLMVHAGLNPGINITMQDPTGPLPIQPPSVSGYLNQPPASSRPQGEQITGYLSSAGNTSPLSQAPIPPAPPSSDEGEESPVDPGRQNSEIAALEQNGFIVAVNKGTVKYDSQGLPIAGGREWVLQVSQRRSSGGYITMIFYCPSGYPASPPRVQVKLPSGSGFITMEPNCLMEWHPGRRLLEVAQEVLQSLPPF
ncbi:MAG TPA: hypothetical protein VKY19_21845 [Ktedonosporobacter sp.]|jgi:hypothetical protein|nr:hypothetical protein [Ktedonosporobacter sp.]